MRARARALSLRSQMLIAVLLAVLLAQGVAVFIAIAAQQEAVRTARTGDALDRITALVFVLERTPPDLHASLLRAVETPLIVLRLDDAPVLTTPSPHLSRLTRRLQTELAGMPPHDVRVAVIDSAAADGAARSGTPVPPDHSMARADHHNRETTAKHPPPRDSRRLVISVSLAPEGWLNAFIRFPRPETGLPAVSMVSFGLTAAAAAAALWLALSRLIGPLRGLASAGERLGRGEPVDELPVTGPAEIRGLTDAFNQMQTRLHRMVSDRTQMLAALGHDLRSPLTALRVEAEMVDDDETRARLLTSLAEMQDMVEQTLTYARGVWTAEAVKTVDVGAFLTDLAEAETPPLPFAQPPSAVLLRLRPATVRRALRNLIDNAQRYGREVTLTMYTLPESVRIEVADRGPGIPEERLAQVFDPFVRIEASRSRETGGTGLGLAIARSIAQAHGGDVVLANRDGGGLVATLILPRPDAR